MKTAKGFFPAAKRFLFIIKGYLFATISIVQVSIAQLMMKAGVAQAPLQQELSSLLPALLASPSSYLWPLLLVAIGIILYTSSMISWLITLSLLPLNRAYPLLSLSYVLVYLAVIFLPWYNEPASLSRIGGIVAIIAGIWWMNRGRDA